MFNYSKSLRGEEGDRYLDKTSIIKGIDPYKLDLKNFEKDPATLPVIDEFQIYDYFVNGISAYTHERFRNFKSFESKPKRMGIWRLQFWSRRDGECNRESKGIFYFISTWMMIQFWKKNEISIQIRLKKMEERISLSETGEKAKG